MAVDDDEAVKSDASSDSCSYLRGISMTRAEIRDSCTSRVKKFGAAATERQLQAQDYSRSTLDKRLIHILATWRRQ